MKAPQIVCCTLFKNPAHYLGMHTIKEGTLNAVNTVAHIGPGIELLAFGMNHIGVLGSDAKEVIKEQAAILARQGWYAHYTAERILRTHISISLHSFLAVIRGYTWTFLGLSTLDTCHMFEDMIEV